MKAVNTITSERPSKCYSCEHARKPASEQLQNQGYVGCAVYTRTNSIDHVIESKEGVEGWVDLRARPFGDKSGVITNLQLMTLETKICTAYQKMGD